ncbi:hypothetical protein BJY04DRAFT_52918 [Aspergillus karnatakaensis]|uniref:uncharacterized protein n=1 Tax=Aspergillus karnatakaensis TaxID=1810916 RepID=UPI003CCCD489
MLSHRELQKPDHLVRTADTLQGILSLPHCRCSPSSPVGACSLGIMLFNLGMTADAAAAHNSELSRSPSETQLPVPSRHSSPRPFSLSTLPSWGKGNHSSRAKSADRERPRYEQRRSMPITAIESISSSDSDHLSNAGPSPARPQFTHQTSNLSQKQSLRPKTIYQLAHPAANARHKRLKLRPKLLLQVQKVPSTSRPLPVFDVLPSTSFIPRIARKVPTVLRGKRGLGPNDLIVATSDLYERQAADAADKPHSSDEENDHREVVATICQLPKEDAIAKGKAEICLNSGPVWEATPLPSGSYEFAAQTDAGLQILRWVRRAPKKRRLSAPPGSIVPEDTRRFTFSVIDPSTRRHPVIATMARSHLEVYDRYSLPSTAPSSPTSAMSVISDGSEDIPSDQHVVETDENLRMLIVVTSIWVAFREGWSHNFRYNDATNTKSARSASVNKKASTAPASEDDKGISGKDSDPEKQASDSNRRVVTWTPAVSQPPATTAYGSLSKRSNSTGAAFIERTNRRNSGARQNVLSSPRESYEGESRPERRNSICSRSQPRKAEKEEPKEIPAQSKAARRAKHESLQTPLDGPAESSRPTKGKLRHRFSNFFDIFGRKNGHRRD